MAHMTLDQITAADFAHTQDQVWLLTDSMGKQAELTLIRISEQAHLAVPAIASRTPFTLVFRAAANIAIPQGLYSISHPQAANLDQVLLSPLFVPHSPEQSAQRDFCFYQAGFG